VPFKLIHGGKYRTENQLNIQTIHELDTPRKSKQCKTQQNKTTLFSCLLQHTAGKRGGLGSPHMHHH